MSTIDQALITALKAGFKAHRGKRNAIISADIIAALKKVGFEGLSGAKIREHVHYLRTEEKLFICGDTSGYYIAENEIEADHQIASLTSRIREITEVRDSLKKIREAQINIAQQSLNL